MDGLIMRTAKAKISTLVIIAVVLVAACYFGREWLSNTITIQQLLSENKQLKAAISNLTAEEQIGYAKVLKHQRGQTLDNPAFC
jgi:hypothetical protein